MSFTVTARHLTYTPAAPGLGQSPAYLVTEPNAEGMVIELFYTNAPDFLKKDQVSQSLYTGERVWKVTEYDRDGDDMDTYYFKNFDDADAHAHAHAHGLLLESYDHDELHAGG